MITAITYLDACLPCYFSGHPGIVLAAPLHAGMTWAELRDEVRNDASHHAFNAEGDDWEGFDASLAACFDPAVIGDLSARIDLIDHDETAAYEASEEAEYGDCCYAYFAVLQSSDNA